jgi:hypothetical protein
MIVQLSPNTAATPTSTPTPTPTTSHASGGWDQPPPVASPAALNENNEKYGTWIPRACHWKTPQRLFTLDPSAKNSNSMNNPRQIESSSNSNNNNIEQQHQQQAPKDFTGGNLLCAPIVVFHKYVLVASDSFLSVYGNFDSIQDEDNNNNSNNRYSSYEESMQRNISTVAIPPLTKFSLSDDSDTTATTTDESFDFGDQIKQMSFHEETGIVYVMTVESCIFQVKLMVDNDLGATTTATTTTSNDISNTDATPASTTQLPRLHLMHHWVTKRLGATCMATLNDGGGALGIDSVCVGYKSGHIEAWNVHQKITPRGRQLQKKGNERWNSASLDWEGFLHDSIRTLSFLPRGNNNREPPQTKTESRRSEMETTPEQHGKGGSLGTPTKASPRKGTAGKAREESYYYLMAVVSISTRIGDKGKQQSTSSMLKILDLKRIANEMRKNSSDRSSTSHEGLSLENYSLPQSRGMELIEATTVSLSKDSRLPKRVPILDSHGANAACNLKYSAEAPPSGSSSCTTGSITFPDGIIGMFSSSSRRDTSDAVGIAQPDHQVLLSYPAIGNGQINIIGDESGKPSSYLAACLRGGTCYLIPISTKNDNKNNSIATIPFPHDIESDLSDIYVQAFTAGNLVVDGIDLPILIYAWPGGVIDVYSCGLMGSKAPTNNRNGSKEIIAEDDPNDSNVVSRAERRCLRDLIDNESISVIAKIVDELRENSQNPLLQMEEWQQLLTEISSGTALPASEEDITLDSLCSIEYQSLRRILLSLALE